MRKVGLDFGNSLKEYFSIMARWCGDNAVAIGEIYSSHREKAVDDCWKSLVLITYFCVTNRLSVLGQRAMKTDIVRQ